MRHLIGIGAAALVILAINLLVATREFFSLFVLGPLALALVVGAVWMLLQVRRGASGSVSTGRAVGGFNAALSSLFFLGICIVIYAFAQRYGTSWDLTQEGRRELSEQTKQVLQNMNREVIATCFFINSDDDLIVIGKEKTLRFLEQAQEYSPFLKVEVEDPQLAVDRMKAMEINFASPQGTIVIHSGARKKVISLSGGSPRLEEREFTNALINVLRNSEPKVYFLTGHGERDLGDAEGSAGAGMLVEVLQRESYAVDRLTLELSAPEVPADCTTLVIHQLDSDLHPREVEAIDAYVRRGGRLLIMMDPWLRVIPGQAGEQLRPWLKDKFGIEMGNDIALSSKAEKSFEVQLSYENAPFQEVEEGYGEYNGSYSIEHPITRAFDQMMILQIDRTVELLDELPAGVGAVELLRTTPDYWAETEVAAVKEKGEAKKDPHEKGGPLSLAVAAAVQTDVPVEEGSEQKKAARLVVVGDSDFASNGQITYPGHLNFVMNTFAWLSEAEDLIAIRPSGKTDPPLVLSPGERRVVAWTSTLLTTQIVLAAGVCMFFWRRRMQ